MHIRWRGLELPSAIKCDQGSLSQSHALFSAEPFERGFGSTVGNSLRRILLSSLEGSAVTQIKIRGAQHEFTTIPGVLEDVTDIVLNVKSLVVKKYTEETRVITVEKNETGAVTGADIQADADVEIINQDHLLATLTDNVPFFMEMVVENGRGYVPSSEHSPDADESMAVCRKCCHCERHGHHQGHDQPRSAEGRHWRHSLSPPQSECTDADQRRRA